MQWKGRMSSQSRDCSEDKANKPSSLYVAECPEVGTVSQGTAVEEATANLREATDLFLEEFPMRMPFRSHEGDSDQVSAGSQGRGLSTPLKMTGES
jgi:hypothetical protein